MTNKTTIANFILADLCADSNIYNNYEYNAKLIDSVVENWARKKYLSPKTYNNSIYLKDYDIKHMV